MSASDLYAVLVRNNLVNRDLTIEDAKALLKATPGARMVSMSRYATDCEVKASLAVTLEQVKDLDFATLTISQSEGFLAAKDALKAFDRMTLKDQAIAVANALIKLLEFETERPGSITDRNKQVNLDTIACGLRWLAKHGVPMGDLVLGEGRDEPRGDIGAFAVVLSAYTATEGKMPQAKELSVAKVRTSLAA